MTPSCEYTREEVIENLQYALAVLADTCRGLEDENNELTKLVDRLTESVPAKSNHHVLTPSDVRAIRQEYERGIHSQKEIADIYNVNAATVNRIVRGIYHANIH